MEESEKRRERLKAMRLEADQANVSSDADNSLGVTTGLTNPLIESSTSHSTKADPNSAPRFDFYTDPMSAFSGNKRRSKVGHQVPQDYQTPRRPGNNTNPAPAPAYQANTYSPDQRMVHVQGVSHNTSSLGSPIRTANSFPIPQLNSPGVFNGSNPYSPDQRMFQPPAFYQGSPLMQRASPYSTPRAYSPSGPSTYYTPSNLSRGGSFPRSSFVQPGGSPSYNYGRGRGQRYNNSSGPSSGRGGNPYPSNTGIGRGHSSGNSMSPGSKQSGRGRFGSHNSVSADDRPDLFYNKSMVEDPWKVLKPVVWRAKNVSMRYMNTPMSQKSFLPKSTSLKKARVLDGSKESTSEPSLAEYLAASFNETIDNEAANNHGV